MEQINFIVIGNSALTLMVVKAIHGYGHHIMNIFTETPEILSWAQKMGLNTSEVYQGAHQRFEKFPSKKIQIICLDPGFPDLALVQHGMIMPFSTIQMETLKVVKNINFTPSSKILAGWQIVGKIDVPEICRAKSFHLDSTENINELNEQIMSFLLESLEEIIIDLSRGIPILAEYAKDEACTVSKKSLVSMNVSENMLSHHQAMEMALKLLVHLYNRYFYLSSDTISVLPFPLPKDCLGHSCSIDKVSIDEAVKLTECRFLQCIFPKETCDDTTLTADLLISLSYRGTKDTENKLQIDFDCQDVNTYRHISRHFDKLWQAASRGNLKTCDDIEILEEDEQKILQDWNDTTRIFPHPATIPSAFEAQAIKTPDHLAIFFNDESISYSQLNNLSNQIARYILNRGEEYCSSQEFKVGLCLNRGILQIAGILAILKIGGVYIPFDNSYPDERLSFMLEDTEANIILIDNVFLASHPNFTKHIDKKCTLRLDEDREAISSLPGINLDIAIAPSQLAYIIYTSGSTGQPKGVMIEHQSLVNLVASEARYCEIDTDSRILHIASIGFDAAGWDIYGALLNGAALFIVDDHVRVSSNELHHFIDQNKISLMTITPALLAVLPKIQLPHLKTIVVMGDLSNAEYLNFWKKDRKLFNGYGPTETTIGATMFEFSENDLPTKIGRPFDNYKAYILDKHNKLAPLGSKGQLAISGIGVAGGYWKRAELTAEKFIHNAFSKVSTYERMYLTGDLARWLPDGNLEFLGRIDDQVKIRGIRIEISEIETLLAKHPDVQQCSVIIRGQAEKKQLIAYWVPKDKAADRQTARQILKKYLEQYLSRSAVPSFFVCMEAFPLTPNGKVDKKNLREPLVEDSVNDQEYIAPRDEKEKVLCSIFSQVLGFSRVGIFDNFFALGGHSLTATQISARISEQLNLELGVREIFEYPTVEQMRRRMEQLCTPIPDAAIWRKIGTSSDDAPPTSSQQRLWYVHQFDPEGAEYNLPFALSFDGNLDIKVLEACFNYLIERHEALRTVFLNRDGVPVQVVQDPYQVELEVQRIPEDLLDQSMTEYCNLPFDLECLPLMRLKLYSIGENKHVLLVIKHNIITDAWSEGLLAREINHLYSCFIANKAPDLVPVGMQCSDIARYLSEQTNRETLRDKLSYWRKKLNNCVDLSLPTDFARPSTLSNKGRRIHFSFSEISLKKLKELSLNHQCTLFMTLIAALNVLLMRYSGQNDIVVGTATAGRNHKEMEGVVGFFVNILPLRSLLDPSSTFEDVLRQFRQTSFEALSNQEVPFEWMVELTNQKRALDRSPLFQVMAILQNANEGFQYNFPGISCHQLPVQTNTTMYEMTWNFYEDQECLRLNLDYSVELYREDTILRFMLNFQELLKNCINNPGVAVKNLGLLCQVEKSRLSEFSYGPKKVVPDHSLSRCFEIISEKHPDNIALRFNSDKLDYKTLNQRANQLARILINKNKGTLHKVSVIGIMMERSIEMVIAFIAITKAGFAYLPLDPSYPSERLESMISHSGAITVLTQRSINHLSEFSEVSRNKFEYIEDLNEKMSHEFNTNIDFMIKPDDLAYIIYTSGSTGRPKGVEVCQQSVINLIRAFKEIVPFRDKDRLLSITTVSFDIFGLELFLPLLTGGELILCDDETARNPVHLVNYLNVVKPSVVQATPTMWAMIADHIRIGKDNLTILCGGESMSQQLLMKLESISKRVINVYGPTETTIWSTTAVLGQGSTINIGKPIDNTSCYIMDEHLNLLPTGCIGELYIGGTGVAKGYHDSSSLTSERFLSNPLMDPRNKDPILYKTGDLACWNENGCIEYKGRSDFQIKIRGFRVELGEIESALLTNPDIGNCVVHAQGEAGDKRIIAYFTKKKHQKEPSTVELREFMEQKLPSFMVPSFFMRLEEFPLTLNNKIDRTKLPLPDQQFADSSTRYMPPLDEIEGKIQEIWQSVLSLDKISVEENFFNVGGNSLHIPQIVSKMNDLALGIKLTIRSFILNSTIRELRKFIMSGA